MSRGCGLRITGGIYWETRVGDSVVDGVESIMRYVMDPPVRLGAMEVTAIGVKMFERDGVWHVLDWVGEEHYPNVADFVEEACRMGVSRRMPRSLDFEKLTPASRLLLVHRRAWIGNRAPYGGCRCPKGLESINHASSRGAMCCGLWWKDLVGVERGPLAGGYRARQTPSVRYLGHPRPEGLSDPVYAPAVFMSVPMTNLAVIHDAGGSRHEAAMERLQGIDRVALVPR